MRPAASLRGRLVLLVGALVLSLSALLLLVVPVRMEALSQRWAESRSLGIGALLAAASEPALDFDDGQAAQALLEKLASTRGAVWAALLRADGSALARWREPPAHVEPCRRGEQQVDYRDGAIAVRLPVESRSGEVGTLALAFDLEELRARLRETRRTLALGGLIALLAGVAAAFAAGTLVIRPLRRMERIAERITRGDLAASTDLQTARCDEAGALARAFQAMLEKLYEQRSALARANEDLGAKLVEIQRMVRLLASSEARTRSVIENALDGIVLVGADGRIEGLNAAAEGLFGFRQAEAIGRPFLETFVAPGSRPVLEPGLNPHAPREEGNPRRRYKVFGRRRDGSELPIECSFTRLEQGPRKTFCAFVRDLADLHRLETELRRAQQPEAAGLAPAPPP